MTRQITALARTVTADYVLLCARCRPANATWRCRRCKRRGCQHRINHLPITRPGLLTGLCGRCFLQPARGSNC